MYWPATYKIDTFIIIKVDLLSNKNKIMYVFFIINPKIMFKYNLINKPKIEIDSITIDTILKSISKTVEINQNWTINLVFLDSESIKNLNNNYRNIDKSTDVLSFWYFDNFSWLDESDTAWELVFSEEKIKTQAIEYGLWEEMEFYKLLIHSVLHILGYDHENDSDYKVMKKLEDKIWKQIFEK